MLPLRRGGTCTNVPPLGYAAGEGLKQHMRLAALHKWTLPLAVVNIRKKIIPARSPGRYTSAASKARNRQWWRTSSSPRWSAPATVRTSTLSDLRPGDFHVIPLWLLCRSDSRQCVFRSSFSYLFQRFVPRAILRLRVAIYYWPSSDALWPRRSSSRRPRRWSEEWRSARRFRKFRMPDRHIAESHIFADQIQSNLDVHYLYTQSNPIKSTNMWN